jgi:hypothetical protein
MMNAINKADFGGARMVTCYTCHRGGNRPEITPSLADQYGAPPPKIQIELKFSCSPPRDLPQIKF